MWWGGSLEQALVPRVGGGTPFGMTVLFVGMEKAVTA